MDWPHKNITGRPICGDFHISLQCSPAGINQTNYKSAHMQNLSLSTSLFSTSLFYNKSCQCTIYLKVIHLNYGVKHKVDVTIAVLNVVIARVNLRNYYWFLLVMLTLWVRRKIPILMMKLVWCKSFPALYWWNVLRQPLYHSCFNFISSEKVLYTRNTVIKEVLNLSKCHWYHASKF